MQYDDLTIQNLRSKENPTDELLTLWGISNHTIEELFVLLFKMQHYQSMVPLLPFVEQRFHRLLYNGEANLQNMSPKQMIKTKDSKINTCNFDRCVQPQQSVNKFNQPTIQLVVSPSNSNNLLVADGVFLPSPQNTGNNEKKINEPPLPKKKLLCRTQVIMN